MQKQIPFIDSPRQRRELVADAEDMERFETAIVAYADHIVCLSEDEADFVRAVGGAGKVSVKIPLLNGIVPSTSIFGERDGIILVASWVAGWGSPNSDGLCWFLEKVLPLVQEEVPWATLRISGAEPPIQLRKKERFGVVFEGNIPDLAPFYGSARVVISPACFGSGVKIKTVEALQHGVPVVSTAVGAEGIDLRGFGAVEITDVPEDFARAICTLLTDEEAWDARRDDIAKLNDAWSHETTRGPSWSEIIHLSKKGSVITQSPTLHLADRYVEVSHA